MNKEYIKPQIIISMFDAEITANDEGLISLTELKMLDGMSGAVSSSNAARAVQRNIDFNKAIQFN